jgi:hypothetical protein
MSFVKIGDNQVISPILVEGEEDLKETVKKTPEMLKKIKKETEEKESKDSN